MGSEEYTGVSNYVKNSQKREVEGGTNQMSDSKKRRFCKLVDLGVADPKTLGSLKKNSLQKKPSTSQISASASSSSFSNFKIEESHIFFPLTREGAGSGSRERRVEGR